MNQVIFEELFHAKKKKKKLLFYKTRSTVLNFVF